MLLDSVGRLEVFLAVDMPAEVTRPGRGLGQLKVAEFVLMSVEQVVRNK